MVYFSFRAVAVDANGKKLLDEQNGGELPLVMFDGWFDEIRTQAAESGATMLLVDTYKRNRDKEKQTYTKQELISGRWKKPQEITFDEYASLFD